MIFVQDAFFFRNLTKHFFFKVLIAFYLMILYNDTGIKRSFDTYDSWEFTFFCFVKGLPIMTTIQDIADKIIAGRTSLCPRSFHPFKGFHPTHPPLFAAPDASAAVLPTPAFAPVLEQWHLQNPFPVKTPPAEILPAAACGWSAR